MLINTKSERLALGNRALNDQDLSIFFENLPELRIDSLIFDYILTNETAEKLIKFLPNAFINKLTLLSDSQVSKDITLKLIKTLSQTLITSFTVYLDLYRLWCYDEMIDKITQDNIKLIKAAKYFIIIKQVHALKNQSPVATFMYNNEIDSPACFFMDVTVNLPAKLQIKICSHAADAWPLKPSEHLIQKCYKLG